MLARIPWPRKPQFMSSGKFLTVGFRVALLKNIPPSLLATLKTIFSSHQIYDIFITKMGQMKLLDEIVLYVIDSCILHQAAIDWDCISALWRFVTSLFRLYKTLNRRFWWIGKICLHREPLRFCYFTLGRSLTSRTVFNRIYCPFVRWLCVPWIVLSWNIPLGFYAVAFGQVWHLARFHFILPSLTSMFVSRIELANSSPLLSIPCCKGPFRISYFLSFLIKCHRSG